MKFTLTALLAIFAFNQNAFAGVERRLLLPKDAQNIQIDTATLSDKIVRVVVTFKQGDSSTRVLTAFNASDFTAYKLDRIPTIHVIGGGTGENRRYANRHLFRIETSRREVNVNTVDYGNSIFCALNETGSKIESDCQDVIVQTEGTRQALVLTLIAQ